MDFRMQVAASGGAGPGGGAGYRHVPVFLDRIDHLLEPCWETARSEGRSPVFIDGTLGLGGHTAALLDRHEWLEAVGIDRDPLALDEARGRLDRFGERVRFAHATYDLIPDLLDDLDVPGADGILLDLGVSSYQLDAPERGFAYSRDVPLDMRMDPTTGASAADVLRTYTADELARIFRVFGEERFAKRIAGAIVDRRDTTPFDSSAALSELIHDVLPAAALAHSGGHPAKRVFQALRIEVNAELETLERAIPAALDALRVGGRMVVLAYHSLEDRPVKQIFRRLSQPDVPDDLPEVPTGHGPALRLLTRGAERVDEAEVGSNPRSASARLRAVERLRGSERRLRNERGSAR